MIEVDMLHRGNYDQRHTEVLFTRELTFNS